MSNCRHKLLVTLVVALALAGCARIQESFQPHVALPPGVAQPALTGVQLVVTPDPLAELAAGRVHVALVHGPVPAAYAGVPLRTDEQVLLQGWLDPPLSLSRAEAEASLRSAVPASGAVNPGPGALARGKLTDLKPGWRAVPVDGIAPTPQTVASGQYPLSGLISVVYPKVPDARAQSVIGQLIALGTGGGMPEAWVRLSVAGDFMLARGVARAMRENGTLYPIAKVKEHLSAADLTFTNLESPIGVKGRALPGKQIWFRAAPEAMDMLKAVGVDGVTVANNHILDYDTDNFLETLDRLDQAGIKYVGGGRNIAEARKPLVLEARGVRIAFLGYSQFADLFFDWNYPRSFAATETVAGVPRIQDDWLAADIQAARAQADVVAVTFHWGDEFQNYPNAEQKRVAYKSIDLGADLVLGFHPHAIQGFELYKQGFIAYSTGNFIMDRQDTDLARESMILDFTVAPSGVRSVSVLPVWIRDEQPYIMTGAEGEHLLQKMRTLSAWK
jgi:poly-gamma-glutamate capsule biosynthesis protein CapA/YwtB (metallophosphatase superfamily)